MWSKMWSIKDFVGDKKMHNTGVEGTVTKIKVSEENLLDISPHWLMKKPE